MDPPPQKSQLFQVYLRLRPPPPPPSNNSLYPTLAPPDRFLTVEESEDVRDLPTHITLNPPNDNRRRAVEKFAFTKVFEEDATQLDIFKGTGVLPLVEGVLGAHGDGRDGLLATLGVTGSGKSHTILGSRSQRGLTQLALDVLFRSISHNILDPSTNASLHATIAASDPSEAQVMSATMFLENMYGDPSQSRASSRAPTPMVVRSTSSISLLPPERPPSSLSPIRMPGEWRDTGSPKSIRCVVAEQSMLEVSMASPAAFAANFIPSFMRMTRAQDVKKLAKPNIVQGESWNTPTPTPLRKKPSVLPQLPDISNVVVDADNGAEYAILISMYEVYNDRIFDLLTPALPGKSTASKDSRRRALLFKPTEMSPDRKVVAGLRKIICGTMREALLVLDAGLHERRVAGTGSNSVSSRSHGFFCVEVKKRRRSRMPGKWGGSALTIVDLAGSERAKDAKTGGQTLQEAGKINESLMYLGQCLQMQSDVGSATKPNLVPFRQCKLTELLFSNSFPNSSNNPPPTPSRHHPASHEGSRNPQKAIMIVTADPLGDFNATSQILRYSALAREITVPRIPSITSTILASSTSSGYFASRGRMSPSDTERETMEIAALEIARMSEEIDGLRSELVSEQVRREEIEAHLESLEEAFEERLLDTEQVIREECYNELEAKLEDQMRSWKATWAAESEAKEEHLDAKLAILSRANANESPKKGENKENVSTSSADNAAIEELEYENQRLLREVELLKRQLQQRSPTRQQRQGVLKEIGGFGDMMGRMSGMSSMSRDLESMRVDQRESSMTVRSDTSAASTVFGGSPTKNRSPTKNASPMKKMRTDGSAASTVAGGCSPTKKKARKLPARKWDLAGEDDDAL